MNIKYGIPTIIFAFAITLFSLTGCGPEGIEESSENYVIGIVNLSSGLDSVADGFREEMTEQGYIEGENVTYIYEGATESIDSLEPAVRGLIEQDVDLILSITTPATIETKRQTEESNIPVVFVPVTDPIASGVVDDLQTPGGNLTGIRSGGSIPRAYDWLATISPNIETLLVFHDPADNSSIQGLAELQDAIEGEEVEIILAEASTDEELQVAFENIPDEVDAAFILPTGFMVLSGAKIADVTIERGIPVSTVGDLVNDGVLINYGLIFDRMGAQAVNLADQILRGSDPGTLPIEDANFALSINLQSADEMGLEISDAVLQQADIIVRADSNP